mgnify:CR=1 FL=1
MSASGHANSMTLEVRNLRTQFFTRDGVLPAVDDVSFSLARGRILGLVGESGSGKSVTGFSIMGLVDPPGRVVGGEILYQGRDLTKLAPRELRKLQGNRIAMVFQDPMMTLNPVLRIDAQMIEAVRAHTSMSHAQAREHARDTLGLMGIPSPEERLRAYPHQLSGGMRQRVAIARALVTDPSLVLMDEPTGNLDQTTAATILALMDELAKESACAFVIVTHDVGLAAHQDRVLKLDAGKLVEQPPEA